MQKNAKSVDKTIMVIYNTLCCRRGVAQAWLERGLDQEVAGSNPVTPTCTKE